VAFGSVPFFVTLIASALPWLAAALDSRFVTFIPDALALAAYACLVLKNPYKATSLSSGLSLLFLFVCFHICFGLARGSGVGSAGLLSLLMLSFIFTKTLEHRKFSSEPFELAWQIAAIYILHIVFIYVEMFFRIAGFTDVIASLFGSASTVKSYKLYNSAPFLNYLGFENLSGVNSSLLGSQSASQLVLIGSLYFAPCYQGWNRKNRMTLPFFFGCLLFPFVASMTATYILMMSIMILVFLIPNSYLNRRLFQLIGIFFLIFFWQPLLELISYRISSYADLQIYLEAFLASPIAFGSLATIEQFMGVGRRLDQANIGAADLGLGMLLIQVGVILLLLVSLAFTKLIYSAYSCIRSYVAVGRQCCPWAAFVAMNTVCALGWAASLVHYTPAIELGGRHIFALHVAAIVIGVRRVSMFNFRPHGKKPRKQVT